MTPGRVVDLPAHAGVLQHLGHGVPVHAADGVGRPVGDEYRAARRAGGIDGARERHEAVRVRRPEHRAVVVVAQGEGVGQRVIEGEVLPAVVAHGEDAVLGSLEQLLHVRADEGAVGALVPAQVLARPAVVEVVGALAHARRAVEVEGQQRLVAPAGPGLGEVPELALRVVVEAPDPWIRAVVVVEGAVLLHEEDHVLNGAEIRAGRLGARRELRHGGAGAVAPARRGQDRPAAGRQCGSEHGAAIEARAVEGSVGCHTASRVIRPAFSAPGSPRHTASRCHTALPMSPRPPRCHTVPPVSHSTPSLPAGRALTLFDVIRTPGVQRRCCGHCRRGFRRDGARGCRRAGAAAGRASPRRPRWPGRARRRRWRGRG